MLGLLLSLIPQSGLIAAPDPEWTAVFDRNTGWTGADGIYSIPLTGGDRVGGWREHATAFVFSDTFIGDVSPGGQRQPGTVLINNSLAVQPPGAGPDPQRIRFLWDRRGGSDGAAFVPNTPNTLPGQFYWLKDGIRLGDQLHVFAARFSLDPPPFTRHGISLVSMDLDSFVPGTSPTVHQVESPLFAEDAGNGSQIAYGGAILDNSVESGAFAPDGYVYVYGIREDPLSKKCLVARVPRQDFTDFNEYRYFDGSGWSTDILDSEPLCGRVSTEMSVTPMPDGRYLMVFMLDTIGGQIALRTAPQPWGPWSPYEVVYDIPIPAAPSGVYSYHAKAHPHLSDERGLLVSFNVNTFGSFWDHFQYADIYRPRFVRIRPQ